MKMPASIKNTLAPCGMNCLVCYAHLKKKRPCSGCLCDGPDKPKRCTQCKIRSCAKKNGTTYCFKCAEFPCKKISSLEKSYNKRYQSSLIDNNKMVNDHGLEFFYKNAKKRWTCPSCGGVVSLHDKKCSDCDKII